jgi:hypothetical protein
MKKEIIPWKFHTRVFNPLGTDLVTDDIVEIIELVKNSYGAGANEVNISFLKNTSSEKEEKTKNNGKKQSKENGGYFIWVTQECLSIKFNNGPYLPCTQHIVR